MYRIRHKDKGILYCDGERVFFRSEEPVIPIHAGEAQFRDTETAWQFLAQLVFDDPEFNVDGINVEDLTESPRAG